jgi:hypothetical protein
VAWLLFVLVVGFGVWLAFSPSMRRRSHHQHPRHVILPVPVELCLLSPAGPEFPRNDDATVTGK